MTRLSNIGQLTGRYSVVLILLGFGIFKFTQTEAEAIKPLVEHSPLLHWMNLIFSTRTISNIIGAIEIAAALSIGLRFFSARMAFYGSVLGSLIFFVTLTFLFSTPGMFTKIEWMWLPDGFIIKDLVLLAFCLWSAGEAYLNLPTPGANAN